MKDYLCKSDSILKTKVKNRAGKELGQIEELMIDTETGTIEYAVLSFGGFLGMGEKYFAIPWKSFVPRTEVEDCMILNIDEKALKNAPGFDKEEWPSMADPRFKETVNTFYSSTYYGVNHPHIM